MKPKVINLLAGPGAGKSTTTAALFCHLKWLGYNVEQVLEYAKGLAWEGDRAKAFRSQQYLYGKQSWYLERVAPEVQFVITDSPLLLSLIYSRGHPLQQELRTLVLATFNQYENLNIYIERGSRAYNPKGRMQTEDEAGVKDHEVRKMLDYESIPYSVINTDNDHPIVNAQRICKLMLKNGWIKPFPQISIMRGADFPEEIHPSDIPEFQ